MKALMKFGPLCLYRRNQMTNQTWFLAHWTFENWKRGPDYQMSSKQACIETAEFLNAVTDSVIFWACLGAA